MVDYMKNKKISLIASDLDGTLILHENDSINSADTLPPSLFPVLDRMRYKNVLFCAASGRSYSSIEEHFGEYSRKICCICENGSYIYSDGELLEVISIPYDIAREICASARTIEGCFVRVNTTEHRYYLVDKEEEADLMRSWEYPDALTAFSFDIISGDITQITVISLGPIDDAADLLIPLWKDKIKVNVAGSHFLDFASAGKSGGLQVLCKHLGIPMEETAAIGDNYNDADMLECAGVPFIMASAAQELLDRFPNHTTDALETICSFLD